MTNHPSQPHINAKKPKYQSIILIAIFLLSSSVVFATPYCGELDNAFGPFDYMDPTKKSQLKLVESFHFDRNVENLILNPGESTNHLGGSLDYTLRAFPNHYRALNTLSKLALKYKMPKPGGAQYTALCYFERAIRFRPNDAMVRSIYSSHLLKTNKLEMALEQLLIAADLEPDNPTTSYNLGLLYLKQKDYEKALHFAKKAYAQNFPLPGLKNQLVAIGKWQ